MSPDMFVLSHRAHTCGTLSISPPIPIEETPMEIHSHNVNMLNEWAAVSLRAARSSSFEWIIEKKKKAADPEEGLAELWTGGFEAVELFSR